MPQLVTEVQKGHTSSSSPEGPVIGRVRDVSIYRQMLRELDES